MCEYDIKDILANWKYQRGGTKQDATGLGQYKELPQTLEELEKMIVENLPRGGVLSAYAEVSLALEHPIGPRTYAELLRLYELCNGCCYFDVSEIDAVLHMDYQQEYEDREFKQVCMDIIVKCPVTIAERSKLTRAQGYLFQLGEEDEVWFAYRKNFFPQEILEELYEQVKKARGLKTRLSWIIAWMSV